MQNFTNTNQKILKKTLMIVHDETKRDFESLEFFLFKDKKSFKK